MFTKFFKKTTSISTPQGAQSAELSLVSMAPATDPIIIELSELTGKFLIATPFMSDTRFRNAVIYICSHSPEKGASGLVVNHTADEPGFYGLLRQFDIDFNEDTPDITAVRGGPMETSRGSVLHSRDYADATTQNVGNDLALSCSLDCLRALASNEGPSQALIAIGHAGWAAGQLEKELAENVWLIADYNRDLLFEISCNHRWTAALGHMGIQPALLSHIAGRG